MILIQIEKIDKIKIQHSKNGLSETFVFLHYLDIIVDFCGNSTNVVEFLTLSPLMNELFFFFPHVTVQMTLGLFVLVLDSLSVLFNGKSSNGLSELDFFPPLLL